MYGREHKCEIIAIIEKYNAAYAVEHEGHGDFLEPRRHDNTELDHRDFGGSPLHKYEKDTEQSIADFKKIMGRVPFEKNGDYTRFYQRAKKDFDARCVERLRVKKVLKERKENEKREQAERMKRINDEYLERMRQKEEVDNIPVKKINFALYDDEHLKSDADDKSEVTKKMKDGNTKSVWKKTGKFLKKIKEKSKEKYKKSKDKMKKMMNNIKPPAAHSNGYDDDNFYDLESVNVELFDNGNSGQLTKGYLPNEQSVHLKGFTMDEDVLIATSFVVLLTILISFCICIVVGTSVVYIWKYQEEKRVYNQERNANDA